MRMPVQGLRSVKEVNCSDGLSLKDRIFRCFLAWKLLLCSTDSFTIFKHLLNLGDRYGNGLMTIASTSTHYFGLHDFSHSSLVSFFHGRILITETLSCNIYKKEKKKTKKK